MISQERYFRGTRVEVDLDAISRNVRNMRSHLPEGVTLIAVVKANAYGHGATQVARTALLNGAKYLAVACLDEALSLRDAHIDAPILVLGATEIRHLEVALKYNITLTVYDAQWIKDAKEVLVQEGQKLAVHVKIDTGMGRLGVQTLQEFSELIELFDEKVIDFEGVFTHFSTADESDEKHYKNQLRLFEQFVSTLKTKPKFVHASNSAAAMRYSESNFNAVRFGIGMYGHSPSSVVSEVLPFELEQAFSFTTKVVQVKKVPKGTSVGYGATYITTEDEWIASLPVGYADGWFRKLQGQEVLVNGLRVPIVGRVCMDQCMIRLPHEIPVGTVVTLIGKNKDKEVTVNEIAEKLKTINYEVLCGISVRVPRVYYKDGQLIEVYNGLF